MKHESMPYLDSKIEASKHKRNCNNPVAKRLYIRDYDDEGKQRFVSWGMNCTTCGVIVKENYEPIPTPQQLRMIKTDKKLEDSKYPKLMERASGHHYNWQESLKMPHKRKVARKLEKLQRKKLGSERMPRKEAGFRTRIGRLKQFYELMGLHWGDLNIAWDDELVAQFLNVLPRPTIKELAEVFQPSWSKVNVESQKWRRYRRYVDDPEKQGWLKSDREKYKELLESEALKRQEMMRNLIKSRAAQSQKKKRVN